jgi:GMP synthase-like glutamine amidotransferase
VVNGARGLVLQHGALGPPALLGEWLAARDIPHVVHEAWARPLPDPAGFRFVASLGSEQSVASSEPAWIAAEVEALRAAVASEVPVLGLCFGGQALSAALGGGVDRLPRCEIGWLTIEPAGGADAAGIPAGPWLHWHDDLLRVPPGARLLARSPAGPAAFRLGPHLGVQFHPEATPEVVDSWARADERLADRGVTRDELAEQATRHAARARDAAFTLFEDWWARGPGSR